MRFVESRYCRVRLFGWLRGPEGNRKTRSVRGVDLRRTRTNRPMRRLFADFLWRTSEQCGQSLPDGRLVVCSRGSQNLRDPVWPGANSRRKRVYLGRSWLGSESKSFGNALNLIRPAGREDTERSLSSFPD